MVGPDEPKAGPPRRVLLPPKTALFVPAKPPLKDPPKTGAGGAVTVPNPDVGAAAAAPKLPNPEMSGALPRVVGFGAKMLTGVCPF